MPSKEILDKCPVSTGFDFPVGSPDAKGYYNAQPFGENKHLGEDWNGVRGGNTDLGDPVYCVSHGIVFFSRDIKAGWGRVIRIIHNIGNKDKPVYVETLYGHVENVTVTPGDIVHRGQKIGVMGNLNGYYYAHLHLEIRDKIGLPIGWGYSEDNKGFVKPTDFIKSHRSKLEDK